jgi:hypothetical protein
VAINLVIGAILIVGANRFLLFHGYPLGYVVILSWITLYAILLGTNSFTPPIPGGKMAPSFAVFARSGPYEFCAFILAAVATYSLPRYELKGRWPRETIEPILPKPSFFLTGEEWAGLALAVLILIAANAWEAYQIVTLF